MRRIFAWIFIPALLISTLTYAQDDDTLNLSQVVPNDWHLLDKAASGFNGISLDKAYELLKGKKSHTVLVAVIDSGVDTLHEDLEPILWKNQKEIPGNGIDEDKDGYIDNYYGWNFLGNPDGRNVKQDSYEAARVYWKWKDKFDNPGVDTTGMTQMEKYIYNSWVKAKNEILNSDNSIELTLIKRMLPILETGDSVISKDLDKEEYNGHDLKEYTPTTPEARATASIILNIQALNNSDDITNKEIINQFQGEIRKAQAADEAPEDYRGKIVQDDYNDINDKFYGNSDVMTGTPTHGTHVSGIIGAVRNNGIGMDGVADNVKIMMIRGVPDGDEHDKDIALAIKYAVDHGARVISMSFGKSFSPQKNWVDEAVKYAAEHDVLLVHAAGNDAKNVDSTDNYPNPDYLFNTGIAPNFITVGANSDGSDGQFTASFSNYGKKGVDVFAPGVNIYSTLPGGNVYGKLSGTSMAAPVVSGVAALLMEYFPKLSAAQVKFAIESSVVKPERKVILPGTQNDDEPVMVDLADICKTGGEVNAFEAVKVAMKLKGERKN